MERVGHALGLVANISSAATVNKTIDVFQTAIEPFGVRLYKSVAITNLVRTRGEQPIASNWPDEWESFYQGSRAFTFDPVAAAGKKSDGFFWRDLPSAPTAAGRQLMIDAREVGMIDGFTAIRRVTGSAPVSANFAGESLDWNELERGVVMLIANSLISRMLYLRDIQITPNIEPLSGRELSILNRAATGRHDKQIALELELSHQTIHFYWKSIRRKLGAADRANAVAIAMWSGQIAP